MASVTFKLVCKAQGKKRLTKRAPDKWESARFTSIFLASSFSCSQAESTPAHTQVTQTVGWLSQKQMSEKTSRSLFIVETVLIALPLSCLGVFESVSLIINAIDAFMYPQLFYVVALGMLAFICLLSIGSGGKLFIVFIHGGINDLRKQHFGWWLIVFAGVLVLVGSLVSNLLPPSREYTAWWDFRFSFNVFVFGSPVLIPFCHLVLERTFRKSNS